MKAEGGVGIHRSMLPLLRGRASMLRRTRVTAPAHTPTLWALGRYLHGHAEVHHGDAGVAVPAHVHHGVATVRGLAFQGGARGAEVVLRLLVGHGGLVRGLCAMRPKAVLLSFARRKKVPFPEPSQELSGPHLDLALGTHRHPPGRKSHEQTSVSQGPTPEAGRPTSPCAREPLPHLDTGPPKCLSSNVDGLVFCPEIPTFCVTSSLLAQRRLPCCCLTDLICFFFLTLRKWKFLDF